MVGMALGDALGARVEFRPHAYLQAHPVKDLEGGGTWGLEKGQFTDDTSMALCLANSLVARRDFIPYDQMVRYKWWYKHGYMSSTGKCFDIGAATRESIERFEAKQKEFSDTHRIPIEQMDYLNDPDLLREFNVFCSKDGVAGNGALMRLAPVPLFFFRDPVKAVQYAGVSGTITHGDQKAADACRLYAAMIVAAVHGTPKRILTSSSFYTSHEKWFGDQPLHEDIRAIADGSYQQTEGYEKGIRGKGYVVDTLKAALWAFWNDDNKFETGVLKAIALGDDTDTTAAIYGQLAGACYGFKTLPKKWTQYVYGKDFIRCLSKWIFVEGSIWSNNYDLDQVLVDTMELFPSVQLPVDRQRRNTIHVHHADALAIRAHRFQEGANPPRITIDESDSAASHGSHHRSNNPMEEERVLLPLPRSSLRRASADMSHINTNMNTTSHDRWGPE